MALTTATALSNADTNLVFFVLDRLFLAVVVFRAGFLAAGFFTTRAIMFLLIM